MTGCGRGKSRTEQNDILREAGSGKVEQGEGQDRLHDTGKGRGRADGRAKLKAMAYMSCLYRFIYLLLILLSTKPQLSVGMQ